MPALPVNNVPEYKSYQNRHKAYRGDQSGLNDMLFIFHVHEKKNDQRRFYGGDDQCRPDIIFPKIDHGDPDGQPGKHQQQREDCDEQPV
jgi:hypothetical protein